MRSGGRGETSYPIYGTDVVYQYSKGALDARYYHEFRTSNGRFLRLLLSEKRPGLSLVCVRE